MKVLVTGGCGFLGSHVCEYYACRGDQVISHDNMTKHELERAGFATGKARNHNRDFLAGMGVKLVTADIRDAEQLLDTAAGCDYIIHTAAQPAMTISVEAPALDLSSNVVGTFNVLETARRLGIPVASCATIHVYGNRINETLTEGKTRYVRQPQAIGEDHPVLEGVLTPLHASKAGAELYVRTYIDTYGVEAVSFRLTGIYGPRQFGGEDHGWVANFAVRSVLGRPITIYGTGKQVRDIVFAADVCRASTTSVAARPRPYPCSSALPCWKNSTAKGPISVSGRIAMATCDTLSVISQRPGPFWAGAPRECLNRESGPCLSGFGKTWAAGPGACHGVRTRGPGRGRLFSGPGRRGADRRPVRRHDPDV